MNLQLLAVTVFVAFAAGASAAVDHGKFEPFRQPEPATISEKAAIKFKPAMLAPSDFCVPLTAVNAAGEINSERVGVPIPPFQCEGMGGQVYGRAGWYKDLWAIMYSWYFPIASDFQSRPHDWHNVVVWIDNPAVKTPKIVGIAMSKSDTEYRKERQLYNTNFAGNFIEKMQDAKPYDPISDTNLLLAINQATMEFSSVYMPGGYQDLIMWEQLTEAARLALNNSKSFKRKAEVPFSDEHFKDHLDAAWPL